MAENVFTLKANYIKTDILNEISNIYASFASGNSDTDLLSKMKENITLPERQLLKEDEQKKFKNRFVSPYEILTLRIKSTIDTGFAEIEADQKSLATLCIERARKTGNKKCAETIENYNDDFERKTENLRSEFSQAVLGKLDEQILKNNNSSIFMLSMFFAVCKQANRLTSLITNNTNTLLTYNMLCLYAENGAASYRIVSSGEDCSKCEVFVGNSIPIDDAVAGKNFIPFHPNCDCMAEILDKDGNVTGYMTPADINSYIKEETDIFTAVSNWFASVLKQLILGDFAGESTLSGEIARFLVGLALSFKNYDIVFDLRDIAYDLIHFKPTPGHIMTLLFEYISLASSVGILKYGNDLLNIPKRGLKYADNIADTAKSLDKASDAAKYADDIADVSKKTAKYSDEVERFISKEVALNHRVGVYGAFTSDAKVTILKEDTIVYRYHGGGAVEAGHWYTTSKTQFPIRDLALPPGNTCKYVDEYIIPKGTKLLEGTVAPNFHQPGGAHQFYITDTSKIIKK